MDEITIRMPDDFHLHLRQGDMLRAVLPHTLKWAKRAIIMPNLAPKPVLTGHDLKRYRNEIQVAAREMGYPDFMPLMTIQLTERTTPHMMKRARGMGAIAAKMYPFGVTHNSEDGVKDITKCTPSLKVMEDVGMYLLLHPEAPGEFVLRREWEFRGWLDWLVETFPGLKIVVEHVTDWRMATHVMALPKTVAATVTVHHLCLTLHDVIGGKLQPHNFCMPVAKYPEDLHTLQQIVFGRNHPKFFLGTDSAPHLKGNKECAKGCAGVFSSLVAMPVLAELFEEFGGESWVQKLESFTSKFGAKVYGLEPNKEELTLVRKPWTVPAECDGVVPFRAGETLQWQVK